MFYSIDEIKIMANGHSEEIKKSFELNKLNFSSKRNNKLLKIFNILIKF